MLICQTLDPRRKARIKDGIADTTGPTVGTNPTTAAVRPSRGGFLIPRIVMLSHTSSPMIRATSNLPRKNASQMRASSFIRYRISSR